MLAKLGYNVVQEIKDLLASLRYKYPEFAARSKKKESAADKYNPKAPEFIKKILNGLGKAVSIVY